MNEMLHVQQEERRTDVCRSALAGESAFTAAALALFVALTDLLAELVVLGPGLAEELLGNLVVAFAVSTESAIVRLHGEDPFVVLYGSSLPVTSRTNRHADHLSVLDSHA